MEQPDDHTQRVYGLTGNSRIKKAATVSGPPSLKKILLAEIRYFFFAVFLAAFLAGAFFVAIQYLPVDFLYQDALASHIY